MCIRDRLYNNIHIYGGKRKNIWSLSLMGVFEASAIVLIYIALKKIPVGEATVIHFTAPVFTHAVQYVHGKTVLFTD